MFCFSLSQTVVKFGNPELALGFGIDWCVSEINQWMSWNAMHAARKQGLKLFRGYTPLFAASLLSLLPFTMPLHPRTLKMIEDLKVAACESLHSETESRRLMALVFHRMRT